MSSSSGVLKCLRLSASLLMSVLYLAMLAYLSWVSLWAPFGFSLACLLFAVLTGLCCCVEGESRCKAVINIVVQSLLSGVLLGIGLALNVWPNRPIFRPYHSVNVILKHLVVIWPIHVLMTLTAIWYLSPSKNNFCRGGEDQEGRGNHLQQALSLHPLPAAPSIPAPDYEHETPPPNYDDCVDMPPGLKPGAENG